jgi:thiamine biosynthesis lipoprotein
MLYFIFIIAEIISLFCNEECKSHQTPEFESHQTREFKSRDTAGFKPHLPQEFKSYRLTGYGQGTTYTIKYYTNAKPITSFQVDSILKEIDASMSLYQPKSLINQFNHSKSGVRMDKHFKIVAMRSLDVYRKSRGMFDITVSPLVQAWNFGPVQSDSSPKDGQIQSIKRHVGSNKIKVVHDSLIKTDPEVKIDLNGIAQGYSVDVLAEFLESRGIHNYLVELGGEIRVKGVKKTENALFTIGIQSPKDDGMDPESMETLLELPDGAVTTSGNYHKYYTSGGKKINHLINPLTGYPFQNEMISATVFAKDAIIADAYDNVFMGMGIEKSFKLLKSHPEMEIYLIYQKEDGSIADTASAGFKRLFKPVGRN